MFRVIITACSLAILTMRACAGGLWALPPRRGVWGGVRPSQSSSGDLGGGSRPNSNIAIGIVFCALGGYQLEAPIPQMHVLAFMQETRSFWFCGANLLTSHEHE